MQINCRVRAKRDGGPIRHPLLARARLNSGNPDAAAEFFQLLFTIKPEERGLHELLDHPYMTATSDAMFRGLTPMYTPPNAHFCEGEQSSPTSAFQFSFATPDVACHVTVVNILCSVGLLAPLVLL